MGIMCTCTWTHPTYVRKLNVGAGGAMAIGQTRTRTRQSREREQSVGLIRAAGQLVRHSSTDQTASHPSPDLIGLPDKFTSWRPDQWRAVELGVEGTDGPNGSGGVVFQCAPTGFGKSPVYVANALLEIAQGGRVVIVTSTKGLQDQLASDFEAAGVTVDIRGKNAYRCVKLSDADDPNGCDVGPCHVGYRCELREAGCLYYDKYRVATQSAIVVTNYSYWMSINHFGQGLGEVTMLILDEGHDAPEWLAGFLSTELTESDVKVIRSVSNSFEGLRNWTTAEWREIAQFHGARVGDELEQMRKGGGGRGVHGDGRRYRDLKRVYEKLSMIAGMEPEHWYVHLKEATYGFGQRRTVRTVCKFDAVNPARYAAKFLFRGVPKVLVFSATVRPKTGELLGLGPGDYTFWEYQSTFPDERHPIIHVPTVRMSYRTTDGELALWLSQIDNIIRGRQDRKGIIHTVSYRRAQLIMHNSQYSHLMLMHQSDNTREVIEQFKRRKGPCVLVSPSVTTGYDFPYDTCEYQIIGKIPFPDTKEGVEKVRAQQDRDWPNYVAAQTLVQMTGRGMRAMDDQCEDFIVDDNVVWFVKKYGHFIPDWWKELYKDERVVPNPPARLNWLTSSQCSGT